MFGDAATFINKDGRVLFGNIFIVSFLGSALGYLIAKCRPGVGKFGCIWLEWFASVSREFDGKFLKNVKSPPLAHKKIIDVLLSSLGYSSRQNLRAAKSELSSFVTAFSVLRFSRSFFSMNESQAFAEDQSTKQKSRKLLLFTNEADSGQNTSPIKHPCFQYLVLYRQVRPPQ